MIGDNLYDYVKTIRSRDDFIKFVEYLNEDYHAKQPEWENNNLQSFLSGLSGFASDMGGYYENMGEEVDIESISWKMAAEMLLAATVYGN